MLLVTPSLRSKARFVFRDVQRATLENEVRSSMKIKIVLEPSDEGGYTAYVPSLPGCISEGEDVQDTLANIFDAVALYLEPIEASF